MSVQTILSGGGGVCENQHFFLYTLTFWTDFYYFHGDFGTEKNLMYTLFLRGGGSQKVYGLYTHENVDIYGQPLSTLTMMLINYNVHCYGFKKCYIEN